MKIDLIFTEIYCLYEWINLPPYPRPPRPLWYPSPWPYPRPPYPRPIGWWAIVECATTAGAWAEKYKKIFAKFK